MITALLLSMALVSVPAQAGRQNGPQRDDDTAQSQVAEPEGTYYAVPGEGAPRPDDDRTGISLGADGSYVLTLSATSESATFHGTWHRQGDQVIFDTIESEPPITLKHVSPRTDEAQRPGQNKEGVTELTTKAVFKPQTHWLSEAMPSWEVRFQFADGETVEALVDPSTFRATASRAGKLRGIRVVGEVRHGGGDVTVPIPPDAAYAEIFTLAVHRIAIETSGTSEPPPPMIITDRGLQFDGSLVFVKEAP